MELFILGRDATGRELVGLLERKARAGVEVRLLVDAFGSLRARGEFLAPLRAAGGRVAATMPMLSRRRPWSFNLRNHLKLVLVDGSVAWTGGMNLTEEYLGRSPRSDRWLDASVLARGPLVADLGAVFANDWCRASGEEARALVAESTGAPQGQARVQVVATGPDVRDDALPDAVLAALGRVRERIWLVTPYFFPDETMSRMLALQARLGRDVRLILPLRSHPRLANLARSRILNELHDAGVRIRLVAGRMLHAKAMVFDHDLAVFGSANLDLRSLYLNFELSLLLYSRAEVCDLATWMGGLERDTVAFERREPRLLERTLADLASLAAPLL